MPTPLLFFGSGAFGLPTLQRLVAEHNVLAIITQPDRPAGRGGKLTPTPIAQWASEHAPTIPILKPEKCNAPELVEQIRAFPVKTYVVIAFGQKIGKSLLAERFAINLHASLLPRWRGAAPIHRAVEAGDAETGVTIMQMDEGLDTGDMLLVKRCPIRHGGPDADTTDTLHARLAALGADLVVRALALAALGRLPATPQPEEGVTYARKIDRAQAQLRWEADAALLERQIRAFDPAPGAWTLLGADVLKVWRVALIPRVVPAGTPAGTVLAVGPQGIDVACGTGSLCITVLQKPGGRRLAVADFLRGSSLQAGMRFEAAATA